MRTLNFFQTDLATINRHFFKKTPTQIVDGYIHKLFKKKNKIKTNHYSFSDICHLNSFYVLQKEIANGNLIEDPLCLSYWNKDTYALTVGKARIMFSEVYKLPVTLIVDNFSEDFIDRYKMTQIDYDISNLTFCEVSTAYYKKKPWYKNLSKAQRKTSIHQYVVRRPEYQQPFDTTYYYKNNCIYREDKLFLQKQNNRWIFPNLS